jgi:hypothetical protein
MGYTESIHLLEEEMRGLLCLLCCAALLLGGAFVSTAEASPEEAAELYRKAETSYKLQKYEEALEDFQRSYELSKEPAILFNIGQCYRQLEQLEDARKSFQFFVRDAPEHPKRSSAEKLIKEINEKIKEQSGNGSIQISSKQTVDILIDGVSRGKPPLVLEDVSPGEHIITAKQEGFADYELHVVVKASQRVELNIPKLVPLSGGTVIVIPAKPFFLGAAGLGSASAISLVFTGLALNNTIDTINFEVSDADTNGDGEVDRDELIAQGVVLDQSIDTTRNRSILSAVLISTATASLITGFVLKKKNKTNQTEAK